MNLPNEAKTIIPQGINFCADTMHCLSDVKSTYWRVIGLIFPNGHSIEWIGSMKPIIVP